MAPRGTVKGDVEAVAHLLMRRGAEADPARRSQRYLGEHQVKNITRPVRNAVALGTSTLARRHPRSIGNRPTAAIAAANRLASAGHHHAHAALQPTDRLFLPPLRPPAAVETPIGPSHYPSQGSQSDAFVQPSLRARHGHANSDSFVVWSAWGNSYAIVLQDKLITSSEIYTTSSKTA